MYIKRSYIKNQLTGQYCNIYIILRQILMVWSYLDFKQTRDYDQEMSQSQTANRLVEPWEMDTGRHDLF